jgi:hypothetical protein
LALRSASRGARRVVDLQAARHATSVARRWGP